MRSFTKKNLPYDYGHSLNPANVKLRDSIQLLLTDNTPGATVNDEFTPLRNALAGDEFNLANKNLINLTNRKAVYDFLSDPDQTGPIKQVFSDLAGVRINNAAGGAAVPATGFGAHFTGGPAGPGVNFPDVTIAAVNAAINDLSPSPDAIQTVLADIVSLAAAHVNGQAYAINNADIRATMNAAVPEANTAALNFAGGAIDHVAIHAAAAVASATAGGAIAVNAAAPHVDLAAVHTLFLRVKNDVLASTAIRIGNPVGAKAAADAAAGVAAAGMGATNNNAAVAGAGAYIAHASVVVGNAGRAVIRNAYIQAYNAAAAGGGGGGAVLPGAPLLAAAADAAAAFNAVNDAKTIVNAIATRLSVSAVAATIAIQAENHNVNARLPAGTTVPQITEGSFNTLNIVAGPPTAADVLQIEKLVVLKQLLRFAEVRSHYTDAVHDIDHWITENGMAYGDSKQYLIKATGLYCAFCESNLSDGGLTDVEHKIPKGTFGGENVEVGRRWSNFVLACKRCNSGAKSDRLVYFGNIENRVLVLPSGDPQNGGMRRGDRATIRNATATQRPDVQAILANVAARIAPAGAQDITAARGPGANENAKRLAAQNTALEAVNRAFDDVLTVNVPGGRAAVYGPLPDGIANPPAAVPAGYSGDGTAAPPVRAATIGGTADRLIFAYFGLVNQAQLDQFRTNLAQTAVYNYTLKFAQDNTVWPDIPYDTAGHINPGNHITAFQAFDYGLKQDGAFAINPLPNALAINLADITLNTHLHVHPTYQMDLQQLAGRGDEDNIRLQIDHHGNLAGVAAVNTAADVENSADNIINICGLNRIIGDFLDQRAVRRTKAWLNAMKQLKILQEYYGNITALRDYYNRQLHPAQITANPGNANRIQGLRNGGGNIAFNTVSGEITFPANIVNARNGSVDWDITANVTVPDAKIPSAGGGAAAQADIIGGNIKGRITNNRITGSLRVTAGGGILNDRIIILWDVPINNGITIAMPHPGDSVISPNPIPVDFQPWEDNRNSLLKLLNKSNSLIMAYIWENILDMVRMGGFYSTWVRTWQHNRFNDAAGNAIPLDIDLVRRLEIQAQSEPDDPFQFHGTDAAEIIQSL